MEQAGSVANERRADVTAKAGGVMTDEVGVVTGDLTLLTTVDPGGHLSQRIQYKDADEWYTVSDVPATLPAGVDLDAFHAATVTRLSGT